MIVPPVMAQPKVEYFTPDAMGCMLLQECKEDVNEVFSMLDISKEYDNWKDFTNVTGEFHGMLVLLNQMGVKVYLADQKYFLVGQRGVYHTVSNNFYLNRAFMHRPHVLMTVMRHEGWHALSEEEYLKKKKTYEARQDKKLT